jgi:hypothetical protein
LLPPTRLTKVVLGCTAIVLSGLVAVTVATGEPNRTGTCSASYDITSQWAGGFNWAVKVTNTGPVATRGWSVTWTYADGQDIRRPYDAVAGQVGEKVTAASRSYKGTLRPGGHTSFGGGGTWSRTNSVPVLTCTLIAAGSSDAATSSSAATTTTAAPTTAPATTTTAPAATTTTSAGATTTAAPAGAVVKVSTAAQLSSALAGAVPGETIAMADGTYEGNFTITVSGTASAPITLTGPANAVLEGPSTTTGYTLHLEGASYWQLDGFTVKDGQKCIMLDSSNHNELSHLNVGHSGDEAVHFRANSSHNTITGSTVHDTGSDSAVYGEGIYIGSARSNWATYTNGNPDRSDYNQVIGNTIYNTTAENIDDKEGTTGNVIEYNHFNGTGESQADAYVDVKGNGTTFDNNDGAGLPQQSGQAGVEVFQLVSGWGEDNTFANNVWNFGTGAPVANGFEIDDSAGNVVYCNNVVVNATELANVACTS